MQKFCKRLADAHWFQNAITIVIVLAGVLVGIETYQDYAARHREIIHVFDQLIIWIFVAEVIIKMAAEGKRFYRYFQDPWNVFDFIIVAACFLPVNAQYVMVLRLARLLRVLKLVRALPKLQVLVGALLKSIPSMAYVSLLLLLLFYVYAVAATFMFGANDPVHFKTLPLSMLSLFRAVTLEDWTDLMYINRDGCANYGYGGIEHLCTASEAYPIGSPFLFVSIVLLGTMIILNLFIGVIMNGMTAAQEENELAEKARRLAETGETEATVTEDIEALIHRLSEIQHQLKLLKHRTTACDALKSDNNANDDEVKDNISAGELSQQT
ncbi:MAG: ion transporter [Deltaproteobacteria bacterium]|nr:ion transporter [Deltaproteobacteria bacterium]